jgi:hypothetical protein
VSTLGAPISNVQVVFTPAASTDATEEECVRVSPVEAHDSALDAQGLCLVVLAGEGMVDGPFDSRRRLRNSIILSGDANVYRRVRGSRELHPGVN